MLPLEIRHKTNKWFKHIIKPSNLLKTTYPQLDQIGQQVKTLRQTTSNHCHSTLTWSTSPRAVQVLLHRHRLLVRQSGNPHQPWPGNVCCMAQPRPTGIQVGLEVLQSYFQVFDSRKKIRSTISTLVERLRFQQRFELGYCLTKQGFSPFPSPFSMPDLHILSYCFIFQV